MPEQSDIHKDQFDAALMPDFRRLVKEIYAEMLPVQKDIAEKLKLEISNDNVWKKRDCPICGEPPRWEPLNHNYSYGMRITRCRVCDFTYSADVLSQEYDNQLYESTERFYEIYLRLKNQLIYQRLEQTKAKYLVQTANQFTPKGKMLDIGSGAGSVVLAAQNDGWEAAGIEPNPLFFKESQKKGLNIYQGFFPILATSNQQPAHNSFSFISMLDVLEHMINPIEFLSSVKEHLTSDGIILIQVPNLNSLYIQLDGEKNTNFCIGHWSYFTPRTLNMTLEKAGFENIFLETYISEFDKVQQFPQDKICRVAQEITGKSVIESDITIDWLHGNLLGYKIFGIYRLKK